MQPNETHPPGPPDPVPARDARSGCPSHQQLKGLLAEQLSAAQREAVETHVEGCPSCQEALARLAGGSAVRGLPGTALSAGLLGRLADAPFPDTAGADPGCDSAGPAPAPPLSAPWLSGGRYEVLGELGRGGMGVVYRARDRRSGRVVALKTMQGRDGLSLELFKREFRHLQGVSHPHLVQLYELESDGRDWLLTMEMVEGVHFLAHVRPGLDRAAMVSPATTAPGEEAPTAVSLPPLRLDRLREALGQLAEGIAALHGHRLLHRDLKPQNVLVTAEGRVVILDFGLAAVLGPTGEHAHTGQLLLGTVPYMAPEQSALPPVSSPGSDWYSVGVMLYQALTGRLPFTGDLYQLMQAKQSRDPVPPRDLCPEVPDDLNDLCLALLRRVPSERPAAAEVLRRLARQPAAPPSETAGDEALLGRESHLGLLGEAYAASRQGRAVLVAVHGPSGVGKSALVRHFLERFRGRGAVVLAGRCYERESVPYKALDPLVDELGRYLQGLPHAEVEGRLPRDIGPLTRVFPILGRLGAVAEAAARSSPPSDPQEVRRRAFAGLRELLARVGDRRPLVLHIDDLQWGDVDSAHLLAELLRPPDPPAILLVASYRSEDAHSLCLRALAEALGKEQAIDRREVPVAPLTERETCELVLRLLGTGGEAHAAAVARESGGNPFFITQLVQEIQSGAARGEGDPAPGVVSLEGLIRARVGRLPEGARRLLEVVAVSGRPLGEAQACSAAGIGAEAPTLVARLESARLVRGTGLGGESHLETYHDRIREAIAAGLTPAARVDYHRGLAATLEAGGDVDPEFLAEHWEAGQQPEKAGRFYALAAARAADALAFDRAAKLYRSALELLPKREVQKGQLRARLGDALANAGRGAEAANEYLEAARDAPTEALDLRGRGARQLLISGHFDDGLGVLREVLAAAGMRWPATPRRALLSLLLLRFRVWLRGTRFREQPEGEVPAEELRRLDIAWSATMGVSMIDTIRGAVFQAQGLLLALRAGEPARVARALAAEAAHLAARGGRPRARAKGLLQAADDLARRHGGAYEIGFVSLIRGMADYFAEEWRASLEHCRRAAHVFRHQCVGAWWEWDTTQVIYVSSLTGLGEVAELTRLAPVLLGEARERGDRYALTTHGSYIRPFVRLAADEASEARGELNDLVRQWSRQGFHLQHTVGTYRMVEIDLYEGDTGAARERAVALWSDLGASLLVRMQHLRILVGHVLARSGVAAALAGSNPEPLLRDAERGARRLEGVGMGSAAALAKLVRAGVAAVRGDAPGAVALLTEAAARFDAADMGLYAAAARRRLGGLLGGEEGRALVARADAWMAGQQIRNPARMTAMLAPGFAS